MNRHTQNSVYVQLGCNHTWCENNKRTIIMQYHTITPELMSVKLVGFIMETFVEIVIIAWPSYWISLHIVVACFAFVGSAPCTQAS